MKTDHLKGFRNKWFLLSVLALTWGSSFILIKKSLDVFTPFQIGSVRVAISGIVLAGIGVPALKKMDPRTLFWTAIAGALGNFLPMYLFPIAQTRVTSSMAGILDSLVPVFVLVIGFIFFRIRSSPLQWAGAIIGFIGAGTLMYFSGASQGRSDAAFALLVVLATACYAGSALIVNRKLANVASLQLSSAVFTLWMIPAVIILFFSDLPGVLHNSSDFWHSAGYLGILSVVGTALAMLLYFHLIHTTSAVFASMVTYLLPLVAIGWGLLAGEPFFIWYVVGGVLILLGIYMVQEKKKDIGSPKQCEKSERIAPDDFRKG